MIRHAAPFCPHTSRRACLPILMVDPEFDAEENRPACSSKAQERSEGLGNDVLVCLAPRRGWFIGAVKHLKSTGREYLVAETAIGLVRSSFLELAQSGCNAEQVVRLSEWMM